MSKTSIRLAILTEIIAPYRIPVLNALARQAGLDLHVMFLAETNAALRQWLVYKDEIRFSYQVLPSWRLRFGRNDLLLNRGLSAALKKVDPQVIICGGYNYPASWIALLWANRRGVRFVLWSESNRYDARRGSRCVEFLKNYFLRHCDGFVVPGKASFEYLTTLGSAEGSISTAPNAVDNDFFATQATSVRLHGAEFREKLKLPLRFILFVGRLVPEKGIFDLLEAYAKLENGLRSDVGLVFAGDGVSRSELAEKAKHISPGTVCFPGFAQREDLAGLYALADVLVLPTHSDPWGLVVNEAMACGLPIIVSNVAGCSASLVENGWNGYIVAPKDVEKLREAISSVVRQPELRQQMSLRSLERIQNYSPEACANGLATAATLSGVEGR
jgi:glycosyltransferase involved in cell wall biosynthesis